MVTHNRFISLWIFFFTLSCWTRGTRHLLVVRHLFTIIRGGNQNISIVSPIPTSLPFILRVRQPDGSIRRISFQAEDCVVNLIQALAEYSPVIEELRFSNIRLMWNDLLKLDKSTKLQNLKLAHGDLIEMYFRNNNILNTSGDSNRLINATSKKTKLLVGTTMGSADAVSITINQELTGDHGKRNSVLVSLTSSVEPIFMKIHEKGGAALLFGETSKLSSPKKRRRFLSNLEGTLSHEHYDRSHEVLAVYELDVDQISSSATTSLVHRLCKTAEELGLGFIGIAVVANDYQPNSPTTWTSSSFVLGLQSYLNYSSWLKDELIILSIGGIKTLFKSNKVHSPISNNSKTAPKFSVEAFHLSKQSIEIFNNSVAKNIYLNATHVRTPLLVSIGSRIVNEIDCALLAVPLALQKSRSKHVYGSNFQVLFPSPRDLDISIDNRQAANDYMLKVIKRLASRNNLHLPLDKDTILRLQDLHLLEYLRKYFSSSTFSSLCNYLAMQRRGRQKLESEVLLPSSVHLEASLLLGSFVVESDDEL